MAEEAEENCQDYLFVHLELARRLKGLSVHIEGFLRRPNMQNGNLERKRRLVCVKILLSI